jgi:SAM-dependent MidA family methyltransferase
MTARTGRSGGMAGGRADVSGGPRPWQDAWSDALYGEHGFYRRPEGPAGHFRTAAHAAPREVAVAVARLAAEAGCTAVVDVGAGRGELLRALHALGTGSGHVSGGATGVTELHGVEVAARPPDLPAEVRWSHRVPRVRNALVVAWELLDVVPCPVLEVDDEGVPREVLVEPATGREHLGPRASAADVAWCASWWPLGGLEPGDRVEVGRARDTTWASLVAAAAIAGGGLLLAVDYAHEAGARPPLGSLTGFRAGRAVPPRPDGSGDVTAHVALDAVAAAGAAAGATTTLVTRQDAALQALGVTRRELLDPGSLGGFGWLVQGVDRELPESLSSLMPVRAQGWTPGSAS